MSKTIHIERLNCKDLWSRLKHQFEINDAEGSYFYKDYLKDEKGFSYFFSNIKAYEDWIDLKNPVSEEDFEQLRESIAEAMFSSSMVMHQVDGLTDKYFRDGNH